MGSTVVAAADGVGLAFDSTVGHTLHTEWVVNAVMLPTPAFYITSFPTLRSVLWRMMIVRGHFPPYSRLSTPRAAPCVQVSGC